MSFFHFSDSTDTDDRLFYHSGNLGMSAHDLHICFCAGFLHLLHHQAQILFADRSWQKYRKKYSDWFRPCTRKIIHRDLDCKRSDILRCSCDRISRHHKCLILRKLHCCTVLANSGSQNHFRSHRMNLFKNRTFQHVLRYFSNFHNLLSTVLLLLYFL